MSDMTDPFEGLDISLEDVEKARDTRKVNRRNAGVCVCGHAAGAHTPYVPEGKDPTHDARRLQGLSICIPSRVVCKCAEYQQVLVAEDLRKFRCSTRGPGPQHALMQGVLASFTAGKEIVWEPTLSCVACHRLKSDGAVLTPVAYSETMPPMERYETTARNVMICVDCRSKIKGAI